MGSQKQAEEIRMWDERISSVIADPYSSLRDRDYVDPTGLLKRTAEAFELRRPRKDGAVGKEVVRIAKEYVESMK